MSMPDELEKSPYCEMCGGCGEVGCDGIKDFLNEHVRGKTDCLNEEAFITDILWMYSSQEKPLHSFNL